MDWGSGGVNKTDSFRHAGLGYREFIVPARDDRPLCAGDDEASGERQAMS
jgi:hypothetical protein